MSEQLRNALADVKFEVMHAQGELDGIDTADENNCLKAAASALLKAEAIIDAALSTHHAAPGAPQQEASGTERADAVAILTRAADNPSFILDRQHLLGLLAYVKSSRAAATAPAGGVTDEQIMDAAKPHFKPDADITPTTRAAYIASVRAVLALTAAARAAEPDGGVTPQGELDPRTALEQARSMTRYVQSFNGQTFSPTLDSVDRQNLATALDNLEETAAMLLNMADRATAARAAEPAPPTGKCTCVYATAKNTPAVRQGYEMGGYVKSSEGCPVHGAPPTGTSQGEGTP